MGNQNEPLADRPMRAAAGTGPVSSLLLDRAAIIMSGRCLLYAASTCASTFRLPFSALH